MAVTSVSTKTTSQTDVASAAQTLIDDNGITSTLIKDVNINTFGANQFIVEVTYG